jgi:predicted ABC-type ATPase
MPFVVISKPFITFAASIGKMKGKNLYIIAGSNGAGKTTASYTVLPEILECKEFVNADEIAHGLSPFNPEGMAVAAGRLMLQRIQELLKAEETFSLETTLSTKSYVNLVRRAQAKDYQVNLLFFWLNSPELAICRVAERVAKGGHTIPEQTIKRRYVAGIRNMFNLYLPIVDYWEIWDNSITPRSQVAYGSKGEETIINESTFKSIKDYV